MPLYVKVIDAKCCGYTTCTDLCPEVYKLDDLGFVFVEDPLVPSDLEEQAAKGAKACPEGAILTSEQPFD